MIDLRKIITQLNDSSFSSLETAFIKSKADNSLYLLKTYRNGNPKDVEIISHLNINSNALYALKSRLYDKIQNQLTNATTLTEEDLLNQVNQIHQICYTCSKEIAIAQLTKLEENLLANDMHGELLVVYSALKQLHLFSDKYYHYSQLYNKQIAYNLTTEKSIEILGNFNRILMQYDFSRSQSDLETLNFLHKGILEQYALNASKQIELIKNIIEIELFLFTDCKQNQFEFEPLDLLKKSVLIIEQLPYYKEQKQWMPVINFLYFEYFNGNSDIKKAVPYFEKINDSIEALPFYSNVCIISKFLISKICFLHKTNSKSIKDLNVFDENIIDSKNTHALVITNLYNSLVLFNNGQLKEAINILNKLINNVSFKDLHFINIEIKLTLAYFYIKMKEMDLAENMLKSVARKIKTEELKQFLYINNFIKLMLLEISPKSKQTKEEQSDLLTLFFSKNTTFSSLEYFKLELLKQYTV